MPSFELLDPDEDNQKKRENLLQERVDHFAKLLNEDFEDLVILCRKKWSKDDDKFTSFQIFTSYSNDVFPLIALLQAQVIHLQEYIQSSMDEE